jgi:hypothetical protein
MPKSRIAAVVLGGLSLFAPERAAWAAAPVDDGIVLRAVTLPVEGKFSYSNDFGDPRSGGRTHQGNDLMAPKMQHLLAAADGKVSYLKVDTGTGGNMLAIRDEDGWTYWYMHINNDTPGTDDGANPLEYAFGAGIAMGTKVKAGQVVAFAGDSGNAEGTGSHLHFEIHPPDGTPVNPYPSLRIAQGFRVGNHCRFDTNPKRKPNAASGSGYWALGADGGVFSFGAALFHGSTGDSKLNRPAVAMAAAPGGSGYWFAASDGGIFAFGDAAYYGSIPSGTLRTPGGDLKLNQPIVGMASTATGKGYWLVARDGGIFAFGDASYYGSGGAMALNQPVVGLAAQPSGKGYWLLSTDGGVFAFGDAAYRGSVPATGLCELPKAARLLPSATGKGYWVAGADGSVRAFGDATDFNSPLGLGLTTKAEVLDLVAVRPLLPIRL